MNQHCPPFSALNDDGAQTVACDPMRLLTLCGPWTVPKFCLRFVPEGGYHSSRYKNGQQQQTSVAPFAAYGDSW